VVIFSVFVWLGLTKRLSMWLALLYAVGTPVFFRTGFLNQNMMVGIFALFSFVMIWRPWDIDRPGLRVRYALAGFFGGLCFLCDYSGALLTALLGLYAIAASMQTSSFLRSVGESLWYAAGAAIPVFLLGLYQYRSFGNPFYPGQHYMPPVEWIDVGYQGVGMPTWELLQMLWFHNSFGLFVTGPVLALGLLAPLLYRRGGSLLQMREIIFILACFLTISIFFSGVQYTRLQWNTGIRYLMAIVPLLYLLAAVVLIRMPRWLLFPVVVLVVAESWAIAMVRSHFGVHESLLRVFLEGFQLPWLSTLSRMATAYAPFLEGRGVSALPFMALAAALIYGVWSVRNPRDSLQHAQPGREEKH
jgi:hypothetical protein